MSGKDSEFEFPRAAQNTYRFQEKTFTDPVIGTLYVRKVAELLSKIMEGRKVANRWRMHEIVSRNVLEREE